MFGEQTFAQLPTGFRKQRRMCFIQTENQRSPVVKKKKFTSAFRYWLISYLHTHTTVLRAARKHELVPYEETQLCVYSD